MKKAFSLTFVFIFLVLSAQPAGARPVSYVGGWTFIEDLSDEKFSSLLHYTLHRNFALGYRYAYSLDKEWHYHGPQVNVLAKRWNNPDSQANFYLHSGLGHAYSDYKGLNNESELGFITGTSLDWEDRRYFISYSNHFMYLGDIDQFFEQKARVGIAPYVAESGALHTWLMIEVKHEEKADNKWTATPLVRFFKDNVMVEVGWTIEGSVLANLRILF